MRLDYRQYILIRDEHLIYTILPNFGSFYLLSNVLCGPVIRLVLATKLEGM